MSKERYDPGDQRAQHAPAVGGHAVGRALRADGTMHWLQLVFGEGPLTAENGFASQADVLIDARLAADLLGATPMDRPEDVQPNPVTGKVYVMLTNNERPPAEAGRRAANPRAENVFGHIVEMTPPDGDHSADDFRLGVLIKCGDPARGRGRRAVEPGDQRRRLVRLARQLRHRCPGPAVDLDRPGRRLGQDRQGRRSLRARDRRRARGLSKLFFRVPVGAEMCGPCFTPDGETLFVAVQHPATDGVKDYKPFGRDSTFDDPATRWPDFQPGMPPRPSIVAIRKKDGGPIG